VPPDELTAEELIDFWSDDHLDAGTRHLGAARSRATSAAAPRAE
jgi:hypothetical protein